MRKGGERGREREREGRERIYVCKGGHRHVLRLSAGKNIMCVNAHAYRLLLISN